MKIGNKVFLTGFVFASSFFSSAASATPSFGAGLKGGLNFANLSSESDAMGEIESDAIMSFAVGGMAELGVTSPFSLLVEALYVQSGAEAKMDMLGTTFTATTTLSYLQIPILAKAKFGQKDMHAYVVAGPNIGIKLAAEAESGGTTTDISDDIAGINFAGDIGVGAAYKVSEFVYLSLDGRYSYGFTDIADDDADDMATKTRDIKLMLGVLFHLTE